jgi:hypothetical protein
MATRKQHISRPDIVRCGHTYYDIAWLEDHEWRTSGEDTDLRGVTHHVPHKIHIRLGIDEDGRFPDRMLREVLLHEVLHVVASVSGMWNSWDIWDEGSRNNWSEVEEVMCGEFSVPLLMVLKSNPELLAYLLDDQDHE